MNIVEYKSNKELCVFGIIDTDRGRAIADDMLAWLKKNYHVYAIFHDGKLFEQPALAFMQQLCREKKQPCLYLHTKGACNNRRETTRVRRMWEHEFTTNKKKYFDVVSVDTPTVACPFTGKEKMTWYNGFVANWQAMDALPNIVPDNSRYTFERLFWYNDVADVKGLILDDIHRSIYDGVRMINKLFDIFPLHNNNGKDIVYIIGNGSAWNDNELRYSLRSLETNGINIGKIFIVGRCPDFIDRDKIIFVPCDDKTNKKHTNILLKIKEVIDTQEIQSDFLISSDDHFYIKETDFNNYPYYQKGELPIDSHDSEYWNSLCQTRAFLLSNGYTTYMTNPHCNTHINCELFESLLGDIKRYNAPDGLEINCLMGNILHSKGQELMPFIDGKINDQRTYEQWIEFAKDKECVSVGDKGISDGFKKYISTLFPTKSIYEKTDISQSDLEIGGKYSVLIKRYQKKYPTCDVWIEGNRLCIRKKGRTGAPTKYTL